MQEPLANQPEQSHEIQCKPCTITAPVCKYFPSPPVGGHAHPRTGEPGQVLSLERDTGLFEGVHFPVLLLVCITSQVEKLCPTRMELSWLSPLFNAGGVSGIDRQHGLSAGYMPTRPLNTLVALFASAAMGYYLHPCSLSKLLPTMEWV